MTQSTKLTSANELETDHNKDLISIRNLSRDEIVDIAVNKFKQLDDHVTINESIASAIVEIVEVNEKTLNLI